MAGVGLQGTIWGTIVLSGLPSGHIDRGKDILHLDLLGVETSAKKVLLGVIGYFHDSRQSGDGGAHGVGATASDKPALLYQARDPEIYARAIHGEFSVKPVCPAFRLQPAAGWLRRYNRVNCKLILLNFVSARLTAALFSGVNSTADSSGYRQSLPNKKK